MTTSTNAVKAPLDVDPTQIASTPTDPMSAHAREDLLGTPPFRDVFKCQACVPMEPFAIETPCANMLAQIDSGEVSIAVNHSPLNLI